MIPTIGAIAHVRARPYLVEEVTPDPGKATLVRLSCLDDDALGETIEVLWENEVDARIHGRDAWEALATRGFDDPELFGAYYHTMRWSSVTSTDPSLFQAPYRAGIEVKAYQLEPLRKALRLPRVNLFIADDVGLGKTIEAGLIVRELLLRQKVRRIVVACPPSVVRQWQAEMEQRFGLTFVIYDREFVAQKRRERGYSINPFHTHSRFVLSHALLRDETYATALRDWLGDFSTGSLLVLDEAHHAAPAGGGKYAHASKLTRAVRDLAHRFEHRLFLSATPHNGHSNSFAALLEILDPQRFLRGVPIKSPRLLDEVMVRRLKKDLRELFPHEFPRRDVVRVTIDGLPDDAPELRLSALLDRYRALREERSKSESKSRRAAALLIIVSLQKRLLSSIEAFARTLAVHERGLAKGAARATRPEPPAQLDLTAPDRDDERADLPEADVAADDDAAVEAASASITSGDAERALVAEMRAIADAARHDADPRVRYLRQWIQRELCPDGTTWAQKRVLIFTEFADTKDYLASQLRAVFPKHVIATFHGGMGDDRREAVKAAFNAHPDAHPLRILIATDAAREGVNLQNYCEDLFHFDVPWNPSRMEQRNGRIDRKLQRASVVRCHYFVLEQRPEDVVLDTLVKKSERIQKELGSLSPVVERRMDRALAAGVAHVDAERLAKEIDDADGGDARARTQVIQDELEATRESRKEDLAKRDAELRALLDKSHRWLGYRDEDFRRALSVALTHMGAEPLAALDPAAALADPDRARWVLPALHERLGADPAWAATLDTLRTPREEGQAIWDWRREAPIRPVVFRDPGVIDESVVHLHLEHRVVQRLLGRFVAAGFQKHELSHACVVRTDDPIPKVILLARLALYGDGAARLHDDLLPIVATREGKKLELVTKDDRDEALRELDRGLSTPRLREVPESVRAELLAHAKTDVAELVHALERRAEQLATSTAKKLAERGESEAAAMLVILDAQRKRIEQHKAAIAEDERQLRLELDKDDRRELEEDKRAWDRRLALLDAERETEPARIRKSYTVKAKRVEPVGICYLWPVS